MTMHRPRFTLTRVLQNASILCTVIIFSFCLASFEPHKVFAQEGVVEATTRWMNAREHKEDQLDDHLRSTDGKVVEIEGEISRIYGVGIGFMGVLTVLQIWQIRHSKGTA